MGGRGLTGKARLAALAAAAADKALRAKDYAFSRDPNVLNDIGLPTSRAEKAASSLTKAGPMIKRAIETKDKEDYYGSSGRNKVTGEPMSQSQYIKNYGASTAAERAKDHVMNSFASFADSLEQSTRSNASGRKGSQLKNFGRPS